MLNYNGLDSDRDYVAQPGPFFSKMQSIEQVPKLAELGMDDGDESPETNTTNTTSIQLSLARPHKLSHHRLHQRDATRERRTITITGGKRMCAVNTPHVRLM